MRWHKSYLQAVIELNRVPPVELAHTFKSKRSDEPCVANSSKRGWSKALPELLERRGIHVVIVIVAEENDIDYWQILECYPRLAHPFGANPTKGTCAF